MLSINGRAYFYELLEVGCDCPYCYSNLGITKEVKQYVGADGECENLRLTIHCSECGNDFILNNIVRVDKE